MHCLSLLYLSLSLSCAHQLKDIVVESALSKFGSESRSSVEAAVIAKDPSTDVTSLSDEALLLLFQQMVNKELAVRAESDPAAAVAWFEKIEGRLAPAAAVESYGLWPWMSNDDLVNQNPSAKTTTPVPSKNIYLSGMSSNENAAAATSLSGKDQVEDETVFIHQETVREITPKPKMAGRAAAIEVENRAIEDIAVNPVKFEEIAKLAVKELDRQIVEFSTLSVKDAALHSELLALLGDGETTAPEAQGMGWLSEENLQALLALKKKL